MYRRQISGQFLYFGLTSAISGNPVTGQSAGISGRVSADGGSQAVVAGSLSEVGGGQYRLNMFTNDTSGNNIGFLFTASGCVPVNFTVVTDNNVSGRIGVVSGTQVNVWSGQLSGQLVTAASGVFGTASLNSGQSVLVYSGQLSGQMVNMLSGTMQLASGYRDEVAYSVLRCNVSGVQSGMAEHSLGTIVLATLEHSVSGTTWTIRQANGTTTHVTKTLTTNGDGQPIIGVD